MQKPALEQNNKVEQIKFGSEICLRVSSSKPYFIYCDGFIDNQLICLNTSNADEVQINFGRALCLTLDLEKSIFRILPFSSSQNFKYLNKLYSYLTDFEQVREKLGKMQLEDRREEISDLR